MPMTNKHGMLMIYCERLVTIKAYNPLRLWSHKVALQINNQMSIFTKHIVTKLARLLRYSKKLHKYAWLIDFVALWGHVTSFRRSGGWKIGEKLDKMVTYQERLSLLRSDGSLITWIMWGRVTNWMKFILHKTHGY